MKITIIKKQTCEYSVNKGYTNSWNIYDKQQSYAHYKAEKHS